MQEIISAWGWLFRIVAEEADDRLAGQKEEEMETL